MLHVLAFKLHLCKQKSFMFILLVFGYETWNPFHFSKRDIARVNFLMHEVHCKRNITLCKLCQEPVPKSEVDEHFEEYHAKIKCDLCKEDFEKGEIDSHKEESCKKRPVECPYCELPFPFDETRGHQDQCGSRTDKCPICDQYVMLKDMAKHESSNCTYPTQSVVKPKASANRMCDDPALMGLPAESSFVRNEVDRMLNPVGAFSYSDASYTDFHPGVTASGARSKPPRLKLNNPSVDKKRSNVAKGRSIPKTSTTSTAGERQNNTTAFMNNKTTQLQDEEDMLARHLLRDLSSSSFDETLMYGEEGTYAADSDMIQLPCEFCGELIPAEDLILHQSGCNPELAHKFVKYNKPNNAGPATPASPSRPRPPNTVNNRGAFNDWNPGYQGYEASPGDDYGQDLEDNLELPCEFCGNVYPVIMLLTHQVVCELNPTATPRTMTPAVPRDDPEPQKVLSRASRRQQDPEFSFASDLNSRLSNLDLENQCFGDYPNSNAHSNSSSRNTSGASRRQRSAAKTRETLENLIQNPTGWIQSNPLLSSADDGGMEFNKQYVTRADRKPAAKPTKDRSHNIAGTLQSNGYEASFAAPDRSQPSRRKPNTRHKESLGSSQTSNSNSSRSGNTPNKSKKSNTRARKV